MWWSTSLSKAGYVIVKAFRDAVFAVQAACFAVLNWLNITSSVMTSRYYSGSALNPVSKDYNDTAFAAAAEINQLTPFDALKVADDQCPEDVVTSVEHFIAHRKHPGFFVATPMESEDTEQVAAEVSSEDSVRTSDHSPRLSQRPGFFVATPNQSNPGENTGRTLHCS